jgi:phosphocarrier protein HPr
MLNQIVKVKNSTGLHARPAAKLAKTIKGYDCQVTLRYEGSEINAASMMNIMRAGIKGGGAVEIICDGQDEAGAMQAIVTLFRERFGETE